MLFRAQVIRVVLVATVAINIAACGDEDTDAANAAQAVANRTPVIGGTPSARVIESEFYDFTPTASDPDGDPIIFGIDGKPGWLDFNTSDGRLYGTPGGGDVGMHRGIVIWVSDGNSESLLPTLDIDVLPATSNGNLAPAISGTPAGSVTAGEFYDFIPVASDVDGDALSFSIESPPGWAEFDSQIGRLSGTPGVASVGAYGNIIISVSDGIADTALVPFIIVVNPPPSQNTVPMISGQPATSVLAGNTYFFLPIASDVDGDPLSFSPINPPSWAQFDSSTGTLIGTPLQSDAGIYNGISIVVSDGEATAALPSFSIEVIAPNSPPTISGTPSNSVLVNNPYAFVPAANDPDGDSLLFSISGQPSWASFDSSNGALSGTPTAGDVGVYGNISISVSDGTGAAALNSFAIDVIPIASGAATLSWTPPTENTDGTPLTDLAGYTVYWGTAPGNYQNSVTLDNPGLTSYVVENLAAATTYYFSTTAYNSAGLESTFSNVASKTFP